MDNKSNNQIRKHLSISHRAAYGIMVSAILLTSCAQEYRDEDSEQIHVSDMTKAETMELAEDVLAQLHFAIDKIDPQTGYIRTRPLSGAQFFEFWRGDNVGAENTLQANLHTIRRSVEMKITQQDEKVNIGCHVRVQRLSLPEREITSSGRAYDMFSRSSPSLQKLELNPEQEKAMAWIDLGEDIPLANEILKRIRERSLKHRIDKQKMTGNET
jgi:hypothetical protein